MSALSASRALFALSALIMAAGGILHALAFRTAAPVIAHADLPPFFAAAYRALWWSDSTCSLVMAVIYSLLAARPATAPKLLSSLLGLIPLATALSMYATMGRFYAFYLLLAAGASAVAGGVLGGRPASGAGATATLVKGPAGAASA
jgi:hypothetical protein